MEQIIIPYGHIYKFVADPLLVQKILLQVKTLNFKPGTSNSQTDDTYYDLELYSWLNQCIRKTADKLMIPESIQLPIVSCWVNQTKKLQIHHFHKHPNSFMSGIFYLTNHQNGGQTVLSPPNLWAKNFDWLDFKASVFPQVDLNITSTSGTLLLFPSNLFHRVQTVKESTERYSIAFNVFLEGKFGDKESKTYLEISAKSVMDRINET